MKICVVAYKFGTAEEIGGHLGAYNYFREKLKTLQKKGHSVFIVAPQISFLKKGTIEIDGIKIERSFWGMQWVWWAWPLNRIQRWLYTKSTQNKVLEVCEREKIDAVYVWQARETGWAISQIKDILDCPIAFRQITTWKWNLDRTDDEFYKNPLIHKLRSLSVIGRFFKWYFTFLRDKKTQQKFITHIYRDFDEILFPSDALRREAFEYGLDKNKGQVLPLAVDTDIFKPDDDKTLHDIKTIVFVGRFELEKKGIIDLLKAVKLLTNDIPNIQLKMAGIGSAEDVEKLLKLRNGLQLQDNIQFLKPVDNNKLPEYYKMGDVVVVPSKWLEAFGRITIEAMACGVPVVSSNAGGIGEINIDGETGLVFEKGDAVAMYEALKKILSDDEYRKKLGANARKRVEAVYNYNAITEGLIDTLKKKNEEIKKTDLTICYFGIYHPYYPRNRFLMKGLRNCKVKIIECNVRDKWFIKYFKLWRKHSRIKNKYDVMFVGFPGHPIMPLAWLLAWLNNKKIIFDAFVSLYDKEVYNYQNCKKGSLKAGKYWLMDWVSIRMADLILLDTMEQVDYFVDCYGYNPEKIKRIFLGSDILDFFKPDLETTVSTQGRKLEIKKPEGKFLVNFNGYFIPFQGVSHIIKAAKLLQDDKDIIFNIIGRGNQYKMITEMVVRENIRNVDLLGEVDFTAVAKYIAISDVTLGVFGGIGIPIRVIPNKVYEAMAMGKPFISANAAVMKEIFTDRENCLLCRENDGEDLAMKILELKNNPELREKIARNGKQIFEEKLTSSIIGKEVREIIENVLA